VVLGVGLDWAEDHHDVALGVPGNAVIEQFRIDHGPDGVARLVARCLALETDPAEVRIVLETRHGLLVEAFDIADGDLGAAVFLRLIERWPSHAELAAAGRDAVEALARAHRHG
jgi:hypothetical protein